MNVKFIAEIRGIVQKTSQKTNTNYLDFHMEDEEGKSFNIISRNLSLKDNLKKGDIVNCVALLQFGKFTKFELLSISK